MMRLFKRTDAASWSQQAQSAETEGLGERSTDDLRQVISDLETVIAEHETTNAFLRDLLSQRWFDAPVDEPVRDRILQHL